MCRLWLSCAYGTVSSCLSQHWLLKQQWHNLPWPCGEKRKKKKHGGAHEHCLWPVLSASHMHLQWHNTDAASRDLWMEDIMRAPMLCAAEVDGRESRNRSLRRRHPHTLPVNQHPISTVNRSQLLLLTEARLVFTFPSVRHTPPVQHPRCRRCWRAGRP